MYSINAGHAWGPIMLSFNELYPKKVNNSMEFLEREPHLVPQVTFGNSHKILVFTSNLGFEILEHGLFLLIVLVNRSQYESLEYIKHFRWEKLYKSWPHIVLKAPGTIMMIVGLLLADLLAFEWKHAIFSAVPDKYNDNRWGDADKKFSFSSFGSCFC